MSDQLYCTTNEIIAAMNLGGEEGLNTGNPLLVDWIKAASAYIERKFGNFIPITATRYFVENRMHELWVEPLLAVTSLTIDTTLMAAAAYELHPFNKHWENGPYTRIYMDDDLFNDKVTIVGRWGKYEATELLGISGSQSTSTETTLVATNGGVISPAMVLLIESEQELVEGYGAASAATSLLNGALDSSQEDVIVDNGAEFYANEVIRCGTEDMHIRAIATHTLYVDRGWNGTIKATHLNDSALAVYRTFNVKRGANGTTAAVHSNKAISRYVVPSDVNWLTRQIAGLMRMKAKANFAGRVGNAELGETAYYNEFPNQIKQIQSNYRIVSI
jgi:hypothetical protein